jgi:hypothetical protein
MNKIRYSVIKRLIIDTLVAIKNVGLFNTVKLYISAAIDRLFDYDDKYDLNEPLDPRDTIPNHPNVENATIYVPTRVRPFIKLLESLSLDKDKTIFVDFGCGKGRALLSAADFGIRMVKGIEFCYKLSSIAQKNSKIYSDQHDGNDVKFEIINDDMSLYAIDKLDNLFYFYNPCNEIVLNIVIQNIISSFLKNPRWGMIVYQNNTINTPIIFDSYHELSFLSCNEYSGNKFFVYKINSDV